MLRPFVRKQRASSFQRWSRSPWIIMTEDEFNVLSYRTPRVEVSFTAESSIEMGSNILSRHNPFRVTILYYILLTAS